jgi:hypothetical protein
MASKQRAWEVYRVKGAAAAFMGRVYAADEKAAEREAVKALKITDPEHFKRLYVRPV